MKATGEGSGLRRAIPWLLLVLVAAYYARSVGSGYNFDDVVHIQQRQPWQGPADAWHLLTRRHYQELPYYRPVVWATFVAQKTLHGDRPALFHAVNALLMGGLAAVGFLLLRDPPFRTPPAVAAVLVLLFSIHPACSAVVYPVTGRETLLPALLLLLATRWFFRDGGFASTRAFVLFTLALFGKEQMVAAPAVFLLAEALGLVPRGPGGLLPRYGKYLAVLAGYAGIRLALFGGREDHWNLFAHPLEPLQSSLYAVQSTFAPFRHVVYEPPFSVWFSPARALVATALLLCLAAAAARLPRARAPQLLFWAGWFVLLQLPSANILWQDAKFDERYLFASLFAPFAVTGTILAEAGARRLLLWLAALGALGVAWVEAGLVRAREFGSPEEFNRRWRETNPGSWIARFNHGVDLMRRGERAAAWAELEAARALNPLPDILTKMARYAEEEGRLDAAAAYLRQAVAREPGNAGVRHELAWLLEQSGDLPGAEAQFRAAVALEPGAAAARAGLGALLARSGRPLEAVEHLREATRLAPDRTATLNNLGRALFDAGRPREAIEVYLRAREREPADPLLLVNLAEAHAAAGDLPAAVPLAAAALPLARARGDEALEARLAELLARWQGGAP